MDEFIKKHITIISPLDLNNYPSLKSPYGVGAQK